MAITHKSARLVIVVLLLASKQIANGNEIKQCPSYCTCDLYENFNRADCSGQRLITPNVEVPTAVELLDLSYNDITSLDNTCFEGLVYVVNLSIAYNSLHTIYLDAFSPLKEAKSIDLSYNRLEYFDERIFETNIKLTRLDLSGNKFMSLQNKPFLMSTSIQYLGLHDAQVTYIYSLMFTAIPALREVDLSNNLMITLSASAFHSLEQLEAVNLEENRWICDKSLDDTLALLKKHGVETKLSSCAISELKKGRGSGEPKMYERMMVAPAAEIAPTESILIEDVWKSKKSNDLLLHHGEICELQNPAKLCELYRFCLANLMILTREEIPQEDSTRNQYTVDDLYFVFATGISIGIAIVTFFVFCVICTKHSLASRRKNKQRRRETTQASHRPIPPPIPPRQRRSTRRRPTPTPLNRSLSNPPRVSSSNGNQNDFATFVAQLFDRPSQRQYCRTINENTANMIRRLSQSNLFNNRLSQHFIGSRNVNSEYVEQAEPFIHRQAIEFPHTTNQPQVHSSPENRGRLSPSAPSMRPETPPPSYQDAIIPNLPVKSLE